MSGLRYMTEDDKVFPTEVEAFDHQRVLKGGNRVRAEVARQLDLRPWPENETSAKRERTKAEYWIHWWLDIDVRNRPERYEYEQDDPETDGAATLTEVAKSWAEGE